MSGKVKFEVPTMKILNDFQKLVYENGGPEKVRFYLEFPGCSKIQEAMIDTSVRSVYDFGLSCHLVACDGSRGWWTYDADLFKLYEEGQLKIK